METEERLDKLEDLARTSLSESMVVNCLLRALIATHPQPDQLKLVFQAVLADREARVADLGFDQGRSERIPQGVIELLREHARQFLAVFPQ